MLSFFPQAIDMASQTVTGATQSEPLVQTNTISTIQHSTGRFGLVATYKFFPDGRVITWNDWNGNVTVSSPIPGAVTMALNDSYVQYSQTVSGCTLINSYLSQGVNMKHTFSWSGCAFPHTFNFGIVGKSGQDITDLRDQSLLVKQCILSTVSIKYNFCNAKVLNGAIGFNGSLAYVGNHFQLKISAASGYIDPSIVQTKANTCSSATTCAVTPSSPVNAGDLLVALIGLESGPFTCNTVTDAHNTWTLDANNQGNGACVFHTINTFTGAFAITYNMASSGAAYINVLDAAGYHAQTPTTATNQCNPCTSVSVSSQTIPANSLAVAAVWSNSGSSSYTATGGFSHDTSGTNHGFSQWQINPTSPNNLNVQDTQNTQHGIAVAIFLPPTTTTTTSTVTSTATTTSLTTTTITLTSTNTITSISTTHIPGTDACVGACPPTTSLGSSTFKLSREKYYYYPVTNFNVDQTMTNITAKIKSVYVNDTVALFEYILFTSQNPGHASPDNGYVPVSSSAFFINIANKTTDLEVSIKPNYTLLASHDYLVGLAVWSFAAHPVNPFTDSGVTIYGATLTSVPMESIYLDLNTAILAGPWFGSQVIDGNNFYLFAKVKYGDFISTTTSSSTSSIISTQVQIVNQSLPTQANFWFVPLIFMLMFGGLMLAVARKCEVQAGAMLFLVILGLFVGCFIGNLAQITPYALTEVFGIADIVVLWRLKPR